MADFVVRAKPGDDLKKRASELFGSVEVTERSGGEQVVRLNAVQADALNRMPVEKRNELMGGEVRQVLTD
jgi:hypothetical protein